MNYKATFLNRTLVIIVILSIIMIIFNYKVLTRYEGAGFLFLIAIIIISFILLILDLIVQIFVRNIKVQRVIHIIIAVAFILFILKNF